MGRKKSMSLNKLIKGKQVKLNILNLDDERKKDLKKGKAFIVKDKKPLDKANKKTMYGIYSPLFGTDTSDDEGYKERYSCSCGEIQGNMFEGEKCHKCKTKVKFVDVDLEIYAYVKLKKFKLINPIMYVHISRIIGAKRLIEILKYPNEIDADGEIVFPEKTKENPYANIGFVDFVKNFDEILEFFAKKQHKETYDIIRDNRDKVFTKSIPVYSFVLRPTLLQGENMFINKVNTLYQGISVKVLNVNKIVKDGNVENEIAAINRKLYGAQYLVNQVYLHIMEELKDKNGVIRGSIMGGRVNFSARNVIVPYVDNLKMDEVELPYLTFLELFKQEIINVMVKLDRISINDAFEKWFYAKLKFNKRVYEIMNYIMQNTKGGLRILINRNPTLVLGSIWCVRIAKVKEDYNDYTMSIPLDIIGPPNADFDGEIYYALYYGDIVSNLL